LIEKDYNFFCNQGFLLRRWSGKDKVRGSHEPLAFFFALQSLTPLPLAPVKAFFYTNLAKISL